MTRLACNMAIMTLLPRIQSFTVSNKYPAVAYVSWPGPSVIAVRYTFKVVQLVRQLFRTFNTLLLMSYPWAPQGQCRPYGHNGLDGSLWPLLLLLEARGK